MGVILMLNEITQDFPGESSGKEPAYQCSRHKKSESESPSVVSDSLWPHGLYSQWNSPDQNTGMGSLSLLQGIFPTQGSNPDLLHCRQILYQLSHKGSPRILEWVAYPFSSGSSWPRNWTRISCTGGGFFTNWAPRGTHMNVINSVKFVLKTWKLTCKTDISNLRVYIIVAEEVFQFFLKSSPCLLS